MLILFVTLYLCGTLVIGYWAGKKVHSVSDFALAWAQFASVSGRKRDLCVFAKKGVVLAKNLNNILTKFRWSANIHTDF